MDAARRLRRDLCGALPVERCHVLVTAPRPGEVPALAARLRAALSLVRRDLLVGEAALIYIAAPLVTEGDDVYVLLDDGLAALPEATGVSVREICATVGGLSGAGTLVAVDGEGLPLGGQVRLGRPGPLQLPGGGVCLFSSAPEVSGGPLRDGRTLLADLLVAQAGAQLGGDALEQRAATALRAWCATSGRSVAGPWRWSLGDDLAFALPELVDEAEIAVAARDAETQGVTSDAPILAGEFTPRAPPAPLQADHLGDALPIPRARQHLIDQQAEWLHASHDNLSPSLLVATGPDGVGKDFACDRACFLATGHEPPPVVVVPRDRRLPFRPAFRALRTALVSLGDDDAPDDLTSALDARLRDLPALAARPLGFDRGPWSRARLLDVMRRIQSIEDEGEAPPPPAEWAREHLREAAWALAVLTAALGWHGARVLRICDIDLGGLSLTAWLKALLAQSTVPGFTVVATGRRNVLGGALTGVRHRVVDVPPLDRAAAMEVLVEGLGMPAARAIALADGLAGRVDPMLLAARLPKQGLEVMPGGIQGTPDAAELRRRMTRVLGLSLNRRDDQLLTVASHLDEPIDTTLLAHLLDRMRIGPDIDHLVEAGFLRATPDGPTFRRAWIRDTLHRSAGADRQRDVHERAAQACRGRLVGRLHRGRARRRVWCEMATLPSLTPDQAEYAGPAVGLGRGMRALGLEPSTLAMAAELSWIATTRPGQDPDLAPVERARAVLWLAEAARLKREDRRARAAADVALLGVGPDDPARPALEVELALLLARIERRAGHSERARDLIGAAPGDQPWRLVEAIEAGLLIEEGRFRKAVEAAPRLERLALQVTRACADIEAETEDDDAPLAAPLDHAVQTSPKLRTRGSSVSAQALDAAWRASRDAGSVYGAFRSLLAAALNAEQRGAILDVPVLAARAVACARDLRDLRAEGDAWSVLCRGLAVIQGRDAVFATLQDARAQATAHGHQPEMILLTIVLAEELAAGGRRKDARRVSAPLRSLGRLRAIPWLFRRYRELDQRLGAPAS